MTRSRQIRKTDASCFIHRLRLYRIRFVIFHAFCNIVIFYITLKNTNAAFMNNLPGLTDRPCDNKSGNFNFERAATKRDETFLKSFGVSSPEEETPASNTGRAFRCCISDKSLYYPARVITAALILLVRPPGKSLQGIDDGVALRRGGLWGPPPPQSPSGVGAVSRRVLRHSSGTPEISRLAWPPTHCTYRNRVKCIVRERAFGSSLAELSPHETFLRSKPLPLQALTMSIMDHSPTTGVVTVIVILIAIAALGALILGCWCYLRLQRISQSEDEESIVGDGETKEPFLLVQYSAKGPCVERKAKLTPNGPEVHG
ncbi:hypothetical protein MJG53_017994 [Ovis ammon polii x Ovis aries]|uniref:Uncharacterized protein n=1 Tax=Ovis ammon polii x Ovis aries TaxID=2918886 RepID=A0ACB9U5L8_9CETA|nr:hypothetical protein MJG53_017994 [Ovis ammon polii x Ovis aries]